MPSGALRLGLGAGLFAFLASVTGEFYRDERIVGQRAVGAVILVLAVVGAASAISYALAIRHRLDCYERALRRAGLDPDQEA